MRTFIVDSFTQVPFRGNPAGVCLAEGGLNDSTMSSVARELNLSETAFVFDAGRSGRPLIRFWSPKMEIPLCGHATLAAAKVLSEVRETDQMCFVNVDGLDLSARNDAQGRIELTFPRYGVRAGDAPDALLSALGLQRVENCVFNEELKILLLEIDDCGRLARLEPDFELLLRSAQSINGVCVTSANGAGEYDFHSRYFWPWSGTDEDPVTGGTHTFLAPYWSQRLNKTRLRSFQASERTGSMELDVLENEVRIRGHAVIVLRGRLSAVQGPIRENV